MVLGGFRSFLVLVLTVEVAPIYLPCVCMCVTRARIPKELHSGIVPLHCSSRFL